jgi:hypothetical protein
MKEFIFLMHGDGPPGQDEDWGSYIQSLQASGHFRGGSALGVGACVRKDGVIRSITSHLSGFIRVEAKTFEDAKTLVAGNPVFEGGGTVEIRELPQTD